MVSRTGEHQATVQIRFEDLIARGASVTPDGTVIKEPVSFVGRRVEVVDVDASGEKPVWLKLVDLGQANIAMQHGLEPSESDPQFHQQMVYAVAMRTLEQFDRALGRTSTSRAGGACASSRTRFGAATPSTTRRCARSSSATSAPARTRRATTFPGS